MKRRLSLKMFVLNICLMPSLSLSAEVKKPEGRLDIPWGTEKSKGLVTRLVPLKASFKSGEPITFRLELRNVGKVPSDYDDQGISWRDNMVVMGPSGKPQPCYGSIAQSSGGERPLAPGKTVVLFDARDLAPDYAITPTETGVYSFQFRGARMLRSRIPASNTLKVTVEGGEKNLFNALLGKLTDGWGRRWEISKVLEGEKRSVGFRKRKVIVNQAYLFHNPTGLKADVVYFDLYQVTEKLDVAEAGKLGFGAPDYSGTFGHLYIKGNENAMKRFPNFKDSMSRMLR